MTQFLVARTFLHLPGIGPRVEKHLWRHGVQDWQALAAQVDEFFSAEKREGILTELAASRDAWAASDLKYFADTLPRAETWRLLDGRFQDTAYFDIEASGGGFPPDAESTVIGFYFRGKMYQEFEYRKKRDLLAFISAEAALLCSYNGNAYDLPFLATEFGNVLADVPHVDLCPWLRRLGLKGGLKAIQKSLAHLHQRLAPDLDGWDAVRLWRFHENGMAGALETLLTYNAEDTVILEQLAVEAFNREAEMRPELGLAKRPLPVLVPLKTRPVDGILERLKAPLSPEGFSG